jgi:hypothetical protein
LFGFVGALGASLRILDTPRLIHNAIFTSRELAFIVPQAPRAAIRGNSMIDLIFVAASVGFFVISVAYTYGCEKLRGGAHD